MRAYRTYYKDKQGKRKQVKSWWIELRDHLHIIRRFPAFTDKDQSEALGRQIVRLVNYKVAGEQLDPQLSRWLEQIPQKLRNRFVKIGLIDSRRAAAGKQLTEHLDDFKESLLAKGNTEKHVNQTHFRAKRIIEEGGFSTWTDISASGVQKYLASLREGKKGISAQTFNYYLKSIKQFCKWMVQDGRAIASPLEHLKLINAKADIRRKRRAFEPDEVRRLLEVTKDAPERYGMTGHQRAMLYRLAIETGLRANELRSLKVSSFNFEKLTVVVEASYSKHRAKDSLPLRPDTAAILKEHFKSKMPNTRAFKVPDKPAKMIQEDLAETAVKDDFGNVTQKAIPYVDSAGRYADFHSLRHTTGSLLAASGVHPKVAQSIMRHGDINLTMSRYTHIFRGQESQAVANLPDLSLPSKDKQQALATGTDGDIDLAENLAENLAFLGGHQRTLANCDGKANLTSGVPNAVFEHARQGSNLQPSDSKSANALTESFSIKELTKISHTDLASFLAQIVKQYPELVNIISNWPKISDQVKKAIIEIMGLK